MPRIPFLGNSPPAPPLFIIDCSRSRWYNLFDLRESGAAGNSGVDSHYFRHRSLVRRACGPRAVYCICL